MEQPRRPSRKVAIADHIWDAFAEMAREMGKDRDDLVNQAMFMFARLHGFLDGWRFTHRNEVGPAPHAMRASVQVLPAVDRFGEHLESAPQRPRVPEREPEGKGKDAVSAPQELLGDDQADGPGIEPREERSEQPEVSALPLPASSSGLYIITDTGEERVVKERYVIGRGKHCDLVINSGKVSREHASISQEGDDWYIEDLGSSNGTWFNKQRIKRRKIEDGDEYFVCSEPIRFALR